MCVLLGSWPLTKLARLAGTIVLCCSTGTVLAAVQLGPALTLYWGKVPAHTHTHTETTLVIHPLHTTHTPAHQHTSVTLSHILYSMHFAVMLLMLDAHMLLSSYKYGQFNSIHLRC